MMISRPGYNDVHHRLALYSGARTTFLAFGAAVALLVRRMHVLLFQHGVVIDLLFTCLVDGSALGVMG